MYKNGLLLIKTRSQIKMCCSGMVHEKTFHVIAVYRLMGMKRATNLISACVLCAHCIKRRHIRNRTYLFPCKTALDFFFIYFGFQLPKSIRFTLNQRNCFHVHLFFCTHLCFAIFQFSNSVFNSIFFICFLSLRKFRGNCQWACKSFIFMWYVDILRQYTESSFLLHFHRNSFTKIFVFIFSNAGWCTIKI